MKRILKYGLIISVLLTLQLKTLAQELQFKVFAQELQSKNVSQDKSAYYETMLLGPWILHSYKMKTGFKSVSNSRSLKFEYGKDRSVKVYSLPGKNVITEGTYRLTAKEVLVDTEPSTYRTDLYILFDFSFQSLNFQAGEEILLELSRNKIIMTFQKERVQHVIKLKQFY